uniref:PPR1 protein n=1 Tax=Solanum tuberosum TaxID=4113 RepID=M1BZR6_SOLTU
MGELNQIGFGWIELKWIGSQSLEPTLGKRHLGVFEVACHAAPTNYDISSITWADLR